MNRKLTIDQLNRLSIEEYKATTKIPLIIVLDNIRSQHNVGSAFRTADAFAIEGIYLCGISAKPPTAEIRKSALGAEESVEWRHFKSSVDCVEELKKEGYTILALEQTTDATLLNRFTPKEGIKYAFIFGHEVRGVSQEVIDRCDGTLEIPQFGTKHSLNVSVSIGIALWHFISGVGVE